MRQPLQLARVFLVVAAMMLAFAFGQGSARAATPSGGTISSAHLTTTWQGEFYTAAAVPDPILCPPPASTSIDMREPIIIIEDSPMCADRDFGSSR